MSLSNEKIYKHSCCVRVRWANPLEHATIRPDLLKPVETRSDLSRPVWTRWDTLQPVETRYPIRSDLLEHVSSRPDEFSIFYFSILYLRKSNSSTLPPPPPPPSPIPPISPPPPIFPFFFFFGEGTATATGSHHHRRSVAPPKGGGDKVPPPSPPSGVYKSNTTCTYAWENKNILWIRKINAYNYNYKLKSVPQKCH